MKKFLFILFLLPSMSFAQSIGIRTGVTVSNLFQNGYTKSLYGSNIGFIYTHNYKSLQFTGELIRNVKGFEMNNTKDKFTYLELPMTIGWVPVNDKFIFGINVGYSLALLWSDRLQSYGNTQDIQTRKVFDVDFITGIKGGIKINENLFVVLNARLGATLTTIGWANGVNHEYFAPFMELGYKF